MSQFKDEILKKYTAFDKYNVKHAERAYKVMIERFELSKEEKELIFD